MSRTPQHHAAAAKWNRNGAYLSHRARRVEAKRREVEPTWWLDTAHFYELAHARDIARRARAEAVNYMRRDVA